jgi:hypothetical protein
LNSLLAFITTYADPGQARYLLRRIRRHIPEARFVATFWGLQSGNDEVLQALGCELVTQLNKAVEQILALGTVDCDEETGTRAWA